MPIISNLLPSRLQILIIRCLLSRFGEVSMTGSSFRAFLSLATIEVAVCAAQHQAAHIRQSDIAALVASAAAAAAVASCLICCCISRVCRESYASRRVILGNSGCARHGETRKRNVRDERRIVASRMYLLYHRPRFFVLHVSLKLESATKRFALFSVVSFNFI